MYLYDELNYFWVLNPWVTIHLRLAGHASNRLDTVTSNATHEDVLVRND